jgi:tRNA A-37 threonylcarbamoyl transferase component Bud32
MSLNLMENNAVDYLASQGLIQASEVRSVDLLGWGVSNTLVKVCTADDCMVVKQSLPQLKVSEEWFADRERIYRERAGIETLASMLPAGTVPQVLYEDKENFLFVMSCAPAEGANWKEQLLQGQVDLRVARKVGVTLGTVHRKTAGVEPVREEFLDDRPFVQLRIDPYHRAAARVHPDLAGAIVPEAQRMLDVKAALVHGDYSPKNIIVTGTSIFLLDFEVVHYGNPVFDLAFMINHLFLKSVYNSPMRQQYFQAVEAFWEGYTKEIASNAALLQSCKSSLERDTVKQLGCLMLARIDGKSPAEYIVSPRTRELVRGIARSILLEETCKLSEVIDLVDSRLT